MKRHFYAWAGIYTIILTGSPHAADVSSMFKTPAPAADAQNSPMALGRKAVDKKDWNEALKQFTAAVEQNPRDADAQNMLAYANRKLKRYDAAFLHYGLALGIDPQHLGAHEYMGEAYAETGKLDRAEEHLKALEQICGKQCEQYRDLHEAIAKAKKKSG